MKLTDEQLRSKKAHAAYAGDADKLKNKLPYAKHTIVKCYMGDHAQCRTHSLACKGRINNNWVSKSSYLGQNFFNTLYHLLSRMRPGSMLERLNFEVNHCIKELTNQIIILVFQSF